MGAPLLGLAKEQYFQSVFNCRIVALTGRLSVHHMKGHKCKTIRNSIVISYPSDCSLSFPKDQSDIPQQIALKI